MSPGSSLGRGQVAGGLAAYLVSHPNAEAPIAAPSPPWPALATGSEASASARSPPGCHASPLPAPDLPPPALIHAALPASPSLVLPVSLTPLGAETVYHASPRGGEAEAHGVSRTPWASPCPSPGRSATWEWPVHGPGPAASLLRISGPGPVAAMPPDDVLRRSPAHCALLLALLPSEPRHGPGGPAGAAPAPAPK